MNTQRLALTGILLMILTMFGMTAFAEQGVSSQQDKANETAGLKLRCQADCEEATYYQVNPDQNTYKQCISACDEQYPESN